MDYIQKEYLDWQLNQNDLGVRSNDIKQKYPDLSVQEKDEGSIYNYVKEAIRLRNTFPALSRGKISIEEDIIALYASDTDKPGEEITDGNVIAYYKKMEDEKDSADDILIVINSGKKANPVGIGFQTSLIVINEGKIVIGGNVGLFNVSIVSRIGVEIDDDVMLGNGVCIWDTDFHDLTY